MDLSGIPNNPMRRQVSAHRDPRNKLPTSTAYLYDAVNDSASELAALVSTVDQDNKNLTEAEKELTRWHCRLGHINFRRVQFLMRSGVLARTEGQRRLHTAACRVREFPKCAACQFGKQKVRPSRATSTSIVRDRDGALSANDLLPGQKVSVDHFISSTRGRLFDTMGRESEDKRFAGGAIFVDHASGLVHVEFQTYLNSHETLHTKSGFELM